MYMYKYLELLSYLSASPKKLQSDYARYNAKLIAVAASRGHITCIVFGFPTNKWFITNKGRKFLEELRKFLEEFNEI